MVVVGVIQGESLMFVVAQLQAELEKMAIAFHAYTGIDLGAMAAQQGAAPQGVSTDGQGAKTSSQGLASGAKPYAQQIAERSKPDMDKPGGVAFT